MDINSAYPSQYVKATDLQNREVTVTMSNVVLEKIGTDTKPVLYFQGKERGMVLNKTNSMAIAAAYGRATENWAGRQIVLYPCMVDYQGKQVQAVRVRPHFQPMQQPPQQYVPPAPMYHGQPAMAGAGQAGPLPAPQGGAPDDDIPF